MATERQAVGGEEAGQVGVGGVCLLAGAAALSHSHLWWLLQFDVDH